MSKNDTPVFPGAMLDLKEDAAYAMLSDAAYGDRADLVAARDGKSESYRLPERWSLLGEVELAHQDNFEDRRVDGLTAARNIDPTDRRSQSTPGPAGASAISRAISRGGSRCGASHDLIIRSASTLTPFFGVGGLPCKCGARTASRLRSAATIGSSSRPRYRRYETYAATALLWLRARRIRTACAHAHNFSAKNFLTTQRGVP